MSTLRMATEAAEITAAAARGAPLSSPKDAVDASREVHTIAARPSDRKAAEPAPASRSKGAIENALTALVKFIPTEVVTLYVAAVSVGPAFKSVIPVYTPTLTYWAFVALTPLIFYLLYLNKLASMDQPVPPVSQWPRWKPVASTIAFGVWALAIPSNPYIQGEAGAAVMGFTVLFVTTILSLVTPIIERSEKTA